jgi:leucyl aminopeptidase
MAQLEISIVRAEPAAAETPLLVLHVYEGEQDPIGALAQVDARIGGALGRVLAAGDFKGKKDQALVLYPRPGEIGAERVLLVGLGKREDYTVDRQRRAVGTAVREAERLGVRRLTVGFGHVDRVSEHMGAFFAARAAVEAGVLAAWDFRELKTTGEQAPLLEALELLLPDEAAAGGFERAVAYAGAVARAQNLARELQARPGNVATPTHLAEVARDIAGRHGLTVTVLGREELEREGFHALLAVAQGSAEEPCFIILEYKGGGDDGAPLVLVGKGVTFDAGGLSIKPADKMEEMKYDMSGAAAVLGAMAGIAELKLRANVVALVPATENLPGGRAFKPGDVIRTHLGKTVEVVNTDAEGRLILADALSYSRRFRPRAVLDAATLTGSCVMALGHHAMGLMGNDGTLLDEVRAAGQRTGERCWPLPLWDEYRSQIDSDVADLKNSGGRAAGTITAGWFLKEFVEEGTPWAHLDIAGTAYGDATAPYQRKGPTGVPTRLFIEWVRSRAEG